MKRILNIRNALVQVLLTGILLTAAHSGCAFRNSSSPVYGSIFDRGYSLPVQAEAFEEYSWNGESQKAYKLFLNLLNEYYYRHDYEKCNIFFFDAIEIYPYDARVYVRLSESLARARDYQRARDILNEGNRRLNGFLNYPGIRSYVSELDNAVSSVESAPEPKGIIGKTTSAIMWPFRKLAWPFKKLAGLF